MVITLSETPVETYDGPVIFKHPPNYEILEVAGDGSFGLTVHAYCNYSTEENVAIKKTKENVAIKKTWSVQWSKSEFRYIKGFIRETVTLSILTTYAKNQHIVHLKTIYFEMGQGDPLDPKNVPYIVMEDCGKSISRYMWKNYDKIKRMDFAAKIVYSVACGLNFLKSFEIYHRDLTPDNICIDTTGRVKIIDLGMARKSPEVSSNVTSGISTPFYRSPNNLLGLKYKLANDRWALGCVFGYILSDSNTFDTFEDFDNHRHIFYHPNMESTTMSTSTMSTSTMSSWEGITLFNIIELIGDPGQDFIKSLDQEINKTTKSKVDHNLSKVFIEYVNKRVRKNEVRKLFGDYQKNDQYNNGVTLLNGLLEWEPEKRISIKKILSHPFVESHRDIDNEGLPSEDVCNKAKEKLDEHEKELMKLSEKENTDKGKGKADAQKYLFEYVADQFGPDKDFQS